MAQIATGRRTLASFAAQEAHTWPSASPSQATLRREARALRLEPRSLQQQHDMPKMYRGVDCATVAIYAALAALELFELLTLLSICLKNSACMPK
mmetsp:Transcript_147080/g.472409  ORF Transcript_147080/g.472409 Transcript_147080/m.472409 type:complete len:95 (+) Transcript_147080:14-298(+)